MESLTLSSNYDIEYRGFKLHSTGLEAVGNPSFEQWEDVGKFIKKSDKCVQFWLGDWVNYGEYRWGEKYSQALDETTYEQHALENMASVARKVESSRRREELSYSHHAEVASLTPDKQEKILDLAEKENLTVQEVRVLVKEEKRLLEGGGMEERKYTPYGDNIFYVSTKWQDSRDDSYHKIKAGQPYPTLKRRSWFYHEDMREFSLREYARVQDFPDSFKFVGTYEKIKDQIGNAVSPKMAKYVGARFKGKTCGDIFAGCGGLTCGLEELGIKSLWAVEREEDFFRTYGFNFPDAKLITQDIRKVDPATLPKVDIIVGGPPCQGFSLSGLRFKDDPRNEMYKEFVRFVGALKPGEFLLENVPQIQGIEDEVIKDFSELGYGVEGFLVKGEDIGMRQKRHRYFFYGCN